MQPQHRVGVMVVRVWVESRLEPVMRARLTAVDDVLVGSEHTVELAAAEPEAITAELKRWLEQWIADR